MTYLLDVNVLVSMAWPNHVHHRLVRNWFERHATRSWATTPVTECGFVRVSSNRSAIPDAVTAGEAITLLARMRAHPGHAFLPDDVGGVVGHPAAVGVEQVVTHRAVTDAHLVALARRHDARLVTLDRGVQGLVSTGDDCVVLIGMPRT